MSVHTVELVSERDPPAARPFCVTPNAYPNMFLSGVTLKVESQVIARAIHPHIRRSVFVNGNETVVFPASPGSYASERMR